MSAEVIPLGAQLRRRRKELGLTQAQVARDLDVARTAYRLWELDAARPAPDRWRLIADWLGVSMTAILFASALIDESDVSGAAQAARGAGLSAADWDRQSAANEGDYFSQERMMIGDQARDGHLSTNQAANLREALSRVQTVALAGSPSARWHAGYFKKRIPRNELAPTIARAAVAATAVGIPRPTLSDASLVMSELVSNSVRHSNSEWIDIAIDLNADRLRIEVGDQSSRPVRPRLGDRHGGWGLALMAELATRWGTDRRADGKTVWIEFDLMALHAGDMNSDD